MCVVTVSPVDDIIHTGRHSCPEAVVARVARLQQPGHLSAFKALVKPPKQSAAEQVGLAIVSPGEGCVHLVNRRSALCRHSPFGQGPRIPTHGPGVFEDPVLRS